MTELIPSTMSELIVAPQRALVPRRRKMPPQRRGESNQVVGTPPEFLLAVTDTFGPLWCDLAALSTNKVAERYFGPDHALEECRDSLLAPWPIGANCWLNPPFEQIGPWARKCAAHVHDREIAPRFRTHIFMLTPASVGANWYRDYVRPYADVYSVGRMKFVGSVDPYPKDLILSHFWKLGGHNFKHWSWK